MGTNTEYHGAHPYDSAGRKRKQVDSSSKQQTVEPSKSPTKKPKTQATEGVTTEKRLRRFRPKPPQSFAEVFDRATTQRFYVLSRKRGGTPDVPEETVEVTGSTGNIYTVVIARQPCCNCPQGAAGNQCKHILYVLSRVLRAKHEYVYQLALLSSELQEIFAGAPPIEDEGTEAAGGGDKRRKPLEGDCPICFCEMEPEGEAIVWCKAACGQNIHKGCFEMWAATKRQQGGWGERVEVTCPYCRSVWEGDDDMVKKIKNTGERNEEGYVNIAEQLGISTERDLSIYSRWWSGHPEAYRRRRY
ncbi:SWIM zinc finger protein [Echria macrotheca]|uniref:SWIM zinc finger protein n=1 Tax=Echria macrotheca TaxID=438768 RepID=A0AAJ0B3W1_9PEZI|nr:SWIM zinc finger protein [Echria macrotheca]